MWTKRKRLRLLIFSLRLKLSIITALLIVCVALYVKGIKVQKLDKKSRFIYLFFWLLGVLTTDKWLLDFCREELLATHFFKNIVHVNCLFVFRCDISMVLNVNYCN